MPQKPCVSGVFLYSKKRIVRKIIRLETVKHLSIDEIRINLKLKNQSSGAKTVPKRNSCEYLLFTGVIFLPAFDLFDLFSTFRITMILQLQTYCFHNLLSGFIIKLIERCEQIIYIRHTVLTRLAWGMKKGDKIVHLHFCTYWNSTLENTMVK